MTVRRHPSVSFIDLQKKKKKGKKKIMKIPVQNRTLTIIKYSGVNPKTNVYVASANKYYDVANY